MLTLSRFFLKLAMSGTVIAKSQVNSGALGNSEDPDRPLNFLALEMSGSSVDGFGPSLPSTDVRLSRRIDRDMMKRYMGKQIRRCLANPAILVLALVSLSSSRRSNPGFPCRVTQSL